MMINKLKPQAIQFSINELANLVMMYEFCERHFQHDFAQNAITKVKRTLNTYIERCESLQESQALESYMARTKSELDTIKILTRKPL